MMGSITGAGNQDLNDNRVLWSLKKDHWVLAPSLIRTRYEARDQPTQNNAPDIVMNTTEFRSSGTLDSRVEHHWTHAARHS